jgi:Ras-related protein Rab-1A
LLETSAKNATNVEEAFVTMTKEIKSRMANSTGPVTPGQGKVRLATNPQKKPAGKKGGFCTIL